MKTKGRILFYIVLAAAAFLGCLYVNDKLTKQCKQLENPRKITSKNSSEFTEGEIVSVEYECIYYGYLTYGTTYGRMRTLQALKLPNKDEYIFVSSYTEDESYFRTQEAYFENLFRAEGFVPKKTYEFVGMVKSTKSHKEELVKTIPAISPEHPVPMTLTNVNYDYEIFYIKPDEIKDSKTRWSAACLFTGLILLVMIVRLFEVFRAEAYLANKKRRERIEAQHMEGRSKNFVSKVEDQDEFFK